MGMSLFGNSGDKTTTTNNISTSYADSFNSTYSRASALSDVGNIYFGWDPNSGMGGST